MEIDYPEYHYHGMGCGLEDRGVTDRYEAMQYGWDEAAGRYESEVVEPLLARVKELEVKRKESEDKAWEHFYIHQEVFNYLLSQGYIDKIVEGDNWEAAAQTIINGIKNIEEKK